MASPCYDHITHTDCPNRAPGCAITCEKWAAFEAEKNRAYAERMTANVARYARRDSFSRARAKKLRYNRK